MGFFTVRDTLYKLAVPLLLLNVFRPVSASMSWRKCDEGIVYSLEPSDVTLNPIDPKSGQKLQFDVHADSKRDIKGGHFTLRVSWGWLPVFRDKQDICTELVDGASCPIAPGPVSFRYFHTLPGDAPHGKYKVKLSGYDEKGQLLNCLQIDFSVRSSEPALENILEKILATQPIA